MNPGTAAVVITGAFFGSFCRAATGFGGSIIFELIYTLCGEFHAAPGLRNALRMVELGMVLEMTNSPLMFLTVARQTPRFWRSLLMLSMLCLPGTMLGSLCLLQAQEHAKTLAALRIGLNLLFLLISIFKLSGEVRTHTKQPEKEVALLNEGSKVQQDDDKTICRELGLGLVLVGFADGFLNGLIGIPGPPSMIYFASVLKSGRMTPDTCMVLTQTFFLFTTFMRGAALGSPTMWHEWLKSEPLALLIPLPALVAMKLGFELRKWLDPTLLLRCILVLLLLSSLMGMDVFHGSWLGLSSLAFTGLWLLVLLTKVGSCRDVAGCAELYPAISLKGRASFDFGPYWKYKPPTRKGHKTTFNVWRNAPTGAHRVDVPQIGNSEMLSIYKEMYGFLISAPRSLGSLRGTPCLSVRRRVATAPGRRGLDRWTLLALAPLALGRRRQVAVMAQAVGTHQLNFCKSADDILASLKTLMEKYEKEVQVIVDADGGSQADPFSCSFGALADADGRAALRSAELTLPALVSGDASTRKAATEAKKELQLILWEFQGTFYQEK
eukprot:s938_g7.t1